MKLRARGTLPRTVALGATALLGLAYALWTLWGAGREATLWGGALLASGFPLWLLMRRFSPADAPAAPRG